MTAHPEVRVIQITVTSESATNHSQPKGSSAIVFRLTRNFRIADNSKTIGQTLWYFKPRKGRPSKHH